MYILVCNNSLSFRSELVDANFAAAAGAPAKALIHCFASLRGEEWGGGGTEILEATGRGYPLIDMS